MTQSALPSALESRLLRLLSEIADPIGPHPVASADVVVCTVEPLMPAAVLIPLTARGNVAEVVLTVRNRQLKSHPGQISFPGGRVEAQDRDVAQTAVRETHEEVGIEPHDVRIIGSLGAYVTGTGFSVVPVLGLIPPNYPYRPDPGEVEEVFHVPLQHLLDPVNHTLCTREIAGRAHEFYAIDYRGYRIWGATARIIVALYERLCSESLRLGRKNPLLNCDSL